MKKRLTILAIICFATLVGSNFVQYSSGDSAISKIMSVNLEALANDEVIIDIPGGGGITVNPDKDKRCTCQSVSGYAYKQCRVEGAFGFIKGRCNSVGVACNTPENNNDCRK